MKKIIAKCDYCLCLFEKKKWDYQNLKSKGSNVFCSKECKNNFIYDINHIYVRCDCCNKWSEKRLSYLKKRDYYYCDIKCYNIHQKDRKSINLKRVLCNKNPMDDVVNREKISKSLKNRNVGFGSLHKKNKHSETSKQKMRKKRLEWIKKNPKKFEKGMKKSLLSNSKRQKISNKHIIEILKNIGVSELLIEEQYRNWDKLYYADFRIGNIVIEYNGDYWHCNPQKYSEDYYHKVCKKTAKEIWQRDRDKKEYLESLGYHVCVVWEYDLKNRKEIVVNNIKKNITKFYHL